MKRNILQYEFLNVCGDEATLESVLAESAARVEEYLPMAQYDDRGPQIKTVVRIYDDSSNTVTRLVQHIEAFQAKKNALLFSVENGIYSTWCKSVKINALQGKIDKAKQKVLEYYSRYLTEAFTQYRALAIEILDHSFRAVERDEHVELFQALRMQKDLWMFVFNPNDLLADKNEMITHFMTT